MTVGRGSWWMWHYDRGERILVNVTLWQWGEDPGECDIMTVGRGSWWMWHYDSGARILVNVTLWPWAEDPGECDIMIVGRGSWWMWHYDSGERILVFQRKVTPLYWEASSPRSNSLTMLTKALWSFALAGTTGPTVQRHHPYVWHLQNHRCENLESHENILCSSSSCFTNHNYPGREPKTFY